MLTAEIMAHRRTSLPPQFAECEVQSAGGPFCMITRRALPKTLTSYIKKVPLAVSPSPNGVTSCREGSLGSNSEFDMDTFLTLRKT